MLDRALMRERARAMRKAPTDAERAMWRIIGRDQLGVRFRRQHRMGDFIADFVCLSRRVVVEVDGGQHNGSAYDARRDAWFKARGFQVLRFWNPDVLTNPDGVGRRICIALGKE
jgi:very-short-patch-repair endonuclease